MLVTLLSHSGCLGSHDLFQLLFLVEGDCCSKSPIHSLMHLLSFQCGTDALSPLQKSTPKHNVSTPLFFPLYILIMHHNSESAFLLVFHLWSCKTHLFSTDSFIFDAVWWNVSVSQKKTSYFYQQEFLFFFFFHALKFIWVKRVLTVSQHWRDD